MKYIFVAGAPGSKWSSVVKNIYYSTSIDRSDYSDERTYYHDADGEMQLMHLGSYFGPGMEFGDWFDKLSEHSKEECEQEFDRPFNGTGVRIIKSHVFAHHARFIKETWPECPLILVHRSNDSCLGWWVRCGEFGITYPTYNKYYKDLRIMSKMIDSENHNILDAWHGKIGTLPSFDNSHTMLGGLIVYNNTQLASVCRIEQPPENYKQDYKLKDINVKVI